MGCNCNTCQSNHPYDQRLRSSAIIESQDTTILIDTGPDLRTQLLRHQTQRLGAILMTHEHNDHTAGIDDVRPFNFVTKKDIPFYVEQRVLDNLSLRFSYIFNKSYSTAAKLAPFVISPGVPFEIEGISITPLRVNHGNLPILGYRIGDLAYITDAKSIPSESYHILQGINTLIVNALEDKIHPTHFSISEALKLSEELQVSKTIITHVSHRMGRHLDKQKTLPENVKLGYDTMRLEFNV